MLPCMMICSLSAYLECLSSRTRRLTWLLMGPRALLGGLQSTAA